MKNKNKFLTGFTLIELIVVIVVLVVLATIVTSNVMNYLTKGKNAAIKGNMANLATHGGTYLTNYEVNEDYSAFCVDSKTQQFLTAIDKTNGDGYVSCYQNEDSWCAITPLITNITGSKDNPEFCVDSSGVKQEKASRYFGCILTGDYYRCSESE